MRELQSIVLASASPRRHELLSSLGLEVAIVPSGVIEHARAELKPLALAAFHAATKADAVVARVPGEIVVAADTVVDLDGAALGKPCHYADAVRMLRSLAGREHVVHTAYTVRTPHGGTAAVASTRVRFAPLDDATIDAYVATGDPFDKAGGYGIQAQGAALVERIDGDFYTVMGFPLGDFVRRLPSLGLRLPVRAAGAVPA